MAELPLVKVVGVSASGKSTLVRALRAEGYNARPASQEHSQTPDMWRRIRPPLVLIYLHVDLAAQRQRRPDVDWTEAWLATEVARLAHARRHADLIIDTSRRTPQETADEVLDFLRRHPIERADHPLSALPGTGGSTADPAVQEPPDEADL